MHRASSFLLISIAALCMVFAPAVASATTLRLPTTGNPAFVVDAPPGWTSNYDQYGNLQFTAADHSSALQLSIDNDPRIKTTTTDQIAANIMKTAGASPYTRSEPSTVVGHPATAYYADMLIRNTHLNVKVIIAKIDDTHAAVITTLTKDSITAAQSAALMSLMEDIQLSDAAGH